MKKTLLAAMLFIGLGAAGFAQTYGDFTVKANADGTVTITKYEGWDTVLNIPATIGGKTVTAIGYEAFKDCNLSGVVIPDGVTYIGYEAFSGNRLTSVVIPGSVTHIGEWAFSGNRLTSVVIPGSVTHIGEWAFDENPLSTVTPGANANWMKRTSYDDGIFGDFVYFNYVCNDRQAGTYRVDKNWDERQNTKEAEGFKYIETPYGAAITGYTGNQKRLAIPETLNGKPVKYINGLNNKDLTAVRIPNTVTTLGDSAFDNNQLTSVVIPDSVKVMEGYFLNDAFYGAFFRNKLTHVTLGTGLMYIGGAAFFDNQLTNVVIPDSVKTIGYGAFMSNQLTSVTIPNSVTEIGSLAFADNRLTSVTIPASVSAIGVGARYYGWAFAGCSGLIVDPRNMTYSSIDGVIFDNAGKTLAMYPSGRTGTSYSIPAGVTTIGEGAFMGVPLRPNIKAELQRRFGEEIFYAPDW